MAERKTESEPVLIMSAEEFMRKYPVSHRAGGRTRNQRNQKAVELVQQYINEKKTGYIVIDNDPFFGSGIAMALRKQTKDSNHIVLHWFDTSRPEVKAEVSKYTRQTSRYLVQVEIV